MAVDNKQFRAEDFARLSYSTVRETSIALVINRLRAPPRFNMNPVRDNALGVLQAENEYQAKEIVSQKGSDKQKKYNRQVASILYRRVKPKLRSAFDLSSVITQFGSLKFKSQIMCGIELNSGEAAALWFQPTKTNPLPSDKFSLRDSDAGLFQRRYYEMSAVKSRADRTPRWVNPRFSAQLSFDEMNDRLFEFLEAYEFAYGINENDAEEWVRSVSKKN